MGVAGPDNSPQPDADAATAQRERGTRRLRWVLPLVLLLVWLGVGGAFGPYAGKLSQVQVNDQQLFLPESAESTVVANAQTRFADDDTVPAVVVFESSSGPLTRDQLTAIQGLTRELATLPGVVDAQPAAVPADDGHAAVAFLPVDGSEQDVTTAAVEEIRAAVAAQPIDGVDIVVGGPAGFAADLVDAFGGIDGLLLLVALVVVLVILLVVYRSPILPFVVLLTSVMALGVASAAIYALADNGVIALNGQAQGILSILVIGAATDYALLLVARYREELRHTESKYDAMRKAWRGVVAPILASGSTVILGVLVLLLSDLKANQALGPVGAIGIAVSMLAALTFLPAVLVLLGRAGFWPARPVFGSHGTESQGGWARVAAFVGRHQRAVWVVPAVILLALGALSPTFKAEGVPQSDFFTGEAESKVAQQALARHFAAGSGSETVVLTPADQLADTLAVLEDAPGVAGAVPQTASGGPASGRGEPQVVDGTALVLVTLADQSDSAAAEATVERLRADLDAVSPDVLVGGPTAAQLDTVTTSQRDNRIIIPAVLAVILLVLIVLLRSLVAPVLLIATVVLSFAATLGLAAVVFNWLLDLPGADPSVPLFAFVFLVALGIDYNIFLMTRAREETVERGTRAGMLRALAVTGGVITSAGLVLAATFGALAVLPLLFLFQLAFLVSVGVLIDTFVVRSLLVPGLVLDVGPKAWWPSPLADEPPTAHPSAASAGAASL